MKIKVTRTKMPHDEFQRRVDEKIRRQFKMSEKTNALVFCQYRDCKRIGIKKAIDLQSNESIWVCNRHYRIIQNRLKQVSQEDKQK